MPSKVNKVQIKEKQIAARKIHVYLHSNSDLDDIDTAMLTLFVFVFVFTAFACGTFIFKTGFSAGVKISVGFRLKVRKHGVTLHP